ncbi:MAG: hypothetical protein JXB48_15245 [Candidatus Latescibacteria bacterium]|nr:hypothetical protein [Candidatus Latescibacterota bacterium]
MKSGLVFFVVLISVYGITFAQTEDYYPLNIGNYWVSGSVPINESDFQQRIETQTVEKNEKVNGNECSKIDSKKSEAGEAYWSHWIGKDEGGNIVEYAFGTEKWILTDWKPPHIIIPKDISQGKTWENRVEGYTDVYPDSVFYAVHSYQVESIDETVTVPAGTFENCLKIRGIIRNYEGETDTILVIYYAKGIGRIKKIIERPDGDDFKSELIEYKIVK